MRGSPVTRHSRSLRRTALVLLAAATLVMPGVAAQAQPQDIVPLGGCGDTYNPSVGGGKASWTLSCSGSNITIKGWVEDTDNDGKCARVTATYSDGDTQTWKACPEGTRTTISGSGPGKLIDAYLTVT